MMSMNRNNPVARRAFTLIEMMVSLAIVVFALAVVANVFALTTRTTQATRALRETRQAVRDLFIELEQDLAQVDPARSVLVLSGWTQRASLTEDDIEAGRFYRFFEGDPDGRPRNYDPEIAANAVNGYSDPRSDLLMFFTQRPGVSKAPPVRPPSSIMSASDRFQRAMYDGVPLSPQLVLYGHAAVGRQSSGGGWPASLTHVINGNDGSQTSRLPLTRWQLARRAAIIRNAPTTGSDEITNLFSTVGGAATYTQQMQRLIGYRTAIFGEPVEYAGDYLALDYDRYLEAFAPSPNPAAIGIGSAGSNLVLRDPYALGTWANADQDRLSYLMYVNGNSANRHVATILDDPTPAAFANQGLRALSGCVSFQVEFLMPEDPRNSRLHPDSRQWDDPERWVAVPPGATYAFVPDTDDNRSKLMSLMPVTPGAINPNPGLGNYRNYYKAVNEAVAGLAGGDARVYIPRTWPYAIRITVRAIDPEGRLAEPIVKSLVHRFD